MTTIVYQAYKAMLDALPSLGVRHIYGSSFTLPPDIPRSLPIDYSADYIAMR